MISHEELLLAAQVYQDLYAPGNSTGAALQLAVLQAHLHPSHTWWPQIIAMMIRDLLTDCALEGIAL